MRLYTPPTLGVRTKLLQFCLCAGRRVLGVRLYTPGALEIRPKLWLFSFAGWAVAVGGG